VTSAESRPWGDPRALLRAQLESAIGADLHEHGLDLDTVLARMPNRFQRGDGIAHALSALLGA